MQNFEFNEEQNKEIETLSWRLRIVSFVMFTLSAIFLFSIFTHPTFDKDSLSDLVSGIVFFIIALWTYNSGTSFKRIVDTEGDDIHNLMLALRELHKLYTVQLVLILFLLGAVFLGITLSLINR